jgi:hypothetical protein
VSKSLVLGRIDFHNGLHYPSDDGPFVCAQDAINLQATLNAKVRTLEVQLSDSRKLALKNYAEGYADGKASVRKCDCR